MPKNNDSRDRSALFLLAKSIAPHKKWVIACAFFSAASAAVSLLLTSSTKQLVTQTVNGDLHESAAWLFVLLILLSALIGGLAHAASGRLGASVGRDLKHSVAGNVMNAEYRSVQSNVSSGDAISVVNHDCKQISSFLSSDLFSLITQLLTGVCAFVYLLTLHPLLGLLTFAYTPIGMIMAGRINRRLKLLYPVASAQKGEAMNAVEQALSSLPVIKSFGMERRLMSRLNAVFQHVYTTDRQIKGWDSLLQPACLSIANAPHLIFTVAGGMLALSGRLELGTFIAITQLLGYIIPPTVMLPFMINNVNKTAASMRRIHTLLQLPQSSGSGNSDRMAPVSHDAAPSIRVDNLSFGWGKPVLRDVSFRLEGAGITVIVGGSGSGKSTLLSLLTGLFRPATGTIRINGQDTSLLKDTEIAQLFSVVPQDIHLFSASILDNIRIGNQAASPDELLTAAQATGVSPYAVAKENGFDTIVGDGGAALSGGQAQKLALARVVVKDASVWLLDEPSSALDGESEDKLLELVREAANDKLILIAAHRPSTIRIADRILFLQGGTITADGTWDEMMRNADFVKTIAVESEAIRV